MKLWILIVVWILGMVACEAVAKPFERLKSRCVGGTCKAPAQKDAVQKPKAPAQKDATPSATVAATADTKALGDRIRERQRAREAAFAAVSKADADFRAAHGGKAPTAEQLKAGATKELASQKAKFNPAIWALILEWLPKLIELFRSFMG